MDKIDYGEILFVGNCNCNCYYCLGNEMNKLKSNIKDNVNIHFNDWKNFDKFIEKLKQYKVKTVYLSSTISEPLLYRHLRELVKYIKDLGFKVGVRTNGYYVLDNLDTFKEFDAEISLSINSFNKKTTAIITGSKEEIEWGSILKALDNLDKKYRVSIVVNRYNWREIWEMLDELREFKGIDYVQLRKIYKYHEYSNALEDIEAFNRIEQQLSSEYKKIGNYFESDIYNYKGLRVSLWKNVFKKEYLASLNYFTDGLVTNNTLLVPAYEEDNSNE